MIIVGICDHILLHSFSLVHVQNFLQKQRHILIEQLSQIQKVKFDKFLQNIKISCFLVINIIANKVGYCLTGHIIYLLSRI